MAARFCSAGHPTNLPSCRDPDPDPRPDPNQRIDDARRQHWAPISAVWTIPKRHLSIGCPCTFHRRTSDFICTNIQPEVKMWNSAMSRLCPHRGIAKMATKSKAKKSVAKKSTNGAARRPVAILKKVGVIATIVKTISRDRGASKNEILDILTKCFPDRVPEQMRATIGIQANRYAKKKGEDEKRSGVIYYGNGTRA